MNPTLGTFDAGGLVIVISAFGTMAVTIIAAISSAFLANRANRNAVMARDSSTENGRKNDLLIEKTAEIHSATNSNLSKLQAALEVATMKIEGLQKLVDTLIAESIAEKSRERSMERIELKISNSDIFKPDLK